jgi:uncharacterized protein (TIGR02284 family)
MSSDVASVLNELIETAKDGEEGFKTAAEKVKQSDLKALFSKYATQRATYARELQAAVSQLGEKPAEHGHIAGSLHRGWINLKEALSKNEDKAIIDEAEAGEDAAKKAYAEALGKSLPTDIRALIEKQNAGILEAHNTVRNLKHGLQQSATV